MKNLLKNVANKVRNVGLEARERIRFGGIEIDKIKFDGDSATNIDIFVNNEIISYLSSEFPDYGIISEESKQINSRNSLYWILDPIDGTKHIVRGLPLYTISLALKQCHDLILGIIYVPETDQLFTAEHQKGAFLNGKRISCSREKNLLDSIICVELPSRHNSKSSLNVALKRLKKLILNSQRIRIIGVGSLGLCYSANGGFDVYVNLGFPSEWDIAGGEIIFEESGGKFSRIEDYIVAGNKDLHESIIKLLSK